MNENSRQDAFIKYVDRFVPGTQRSSFDFDAGWFARQPEIDIHKGLWEEECLTSASLRKQGNEYWMQVLDFTQQLSALKLENKQLKDRIAELEAQVASQHTTVKRLNAQLFKENEMSEHIIRMPNDLNADAVGGQENL